MRYAWICRRLHTTHLWVPATRHTSPRDYPPALARFHTAYTITPGGWVTLTTAVHTFLVSRLLRLSATAASRCMRMLRSVLHVWLHLHRCLHAGLPTFCRSFPGFSLRHVRFCVVVITFLPIYRVYTTTAPFTRSPHACTQFTFTAGPHRFTVDFLVRFYR